jgi:type I restriction enzyme S subunit
VIDNALAAGNPIPDELEAKAAARQALGDARKPLPEDIRSLFPNAFVFTEEMGWIPEGWKITPFGEILENTIGGDWGKETQDEKHTEQTVIIRGTDIPDLKSGLQSSAPTRWVEQKKLKTRQLEDGDIVIEISGGSPKQPTGRSLYITKELLQRLGGVVEPASFCRRFKPLDKYLGLYASLHLEKIYSDGKMWEYQNQSTGISNFQTSSFLEREFVLLPKETGLLRELYSHVRPLIKKISSPQQIQLTELRDTLLPKLLSGELRIPEADQLIKETLA